MIKKRFLTEELQAVASKELGIKCIVGEPLSSTFDMFVNTLHSNIKINLPDKNKAGVMSNYLHKLKQGGKADFVALCVKSMKRTHNMLNDKRLRKDVWEHKKSLYGNVTSPLSNTLSTPEGKYITGALPADKFYKTSEWRKLRYSILKLYGPQCMLCGATKESGSVLHVDHIKPRHLYPELAFDVKNLQVLCEDCNVGKHYSYSHSDWRGR